MRTRSLIARFMTAAVMIAAGTLSACASATRSDTAVIESNAPTSDPTVVETESPGTVPAELADTSWVLDGHLTVGGLQPYPDGTDAGLTFTADGQLTVNTGCNTGSAAVGFDEESTLSVTSLAITEKACADDDLAAIERGVLSILAEPLHWSAHDDVLVLYPQNISDTGLHFVAA